MSDEEKTQIWKELKEGRREIGLLAREGAFRVSEKTSEALWELYKKLGRAGNHPMEGIEIQWKAVSDCREIVLAEAKKDLGTESKWYQI